MPSRLVTEVECSGHDRVRVDLRDLSAGSYKLVTELRSATGTAKARAEYLFEKPDSGNSYATIDVNNNFIFNGRKKFLITGFGTSLTSLATWAHAPYLNVAYGQAWSQNNVNTSFENGVGFFDKYLLAANGLDLHVIGPTVTGAGKKAVAPLTDAIVLDYLTKFAERTTLIGWDWMDEPDFNNYSPVDCKGWWDLTKASSPGKWTHVNFMGGTFLGSDYNINKAHGYCYPYLVADVYSFDLYPYEYSATTGIADMALVVDRMRSWNFDLVPVMAYVASTDVRPGQGGGMPSPPQVTLQAWLCVIRGVKGIHWYPYQGTMPAANYQAMKDFVSDIDELSDVVLSDADIRVVHSGVGSNDVYVLG